MLETIDLQGWCMW